MGLSAPEMNVSSIVITCRLRTERELTLIARELELTKKMLARARRCAPPHARGIDFIIVVYWIFSFIVSREGEKPAFWRGNATLTHLPQSNYVQKVEQDAQNRVEFLSDEDRDKTTRKLNAAVQDLELSNKGLRRENKGLKTSLESVKEEANIALERFFIKFDEIKFDDDAKPLGRGATAVVLRAEYYGQRVAVKRVDARQSIDNLEEGAATLFHELEKVAPLEHRNIIELIGGCWGFEEDELNKTCIVGLREALPCAR